MKHSLLVVVILAAAMPLLILGQTSPAVVTKFLVLFDQFRAAENSEGGRRRATCGLPAQPKARTTTT